MRRRPSGSEDEASSSESTASTDGDKRKEVDVPRTVPLPDELGVTGRRRSNGGQSAWSRPPGKNTPDEKDMLSSLEEHTMKERQLRRGRLRNPWALSLITLGTMACSIFLILVIAQSFLTRQLDPKGCAMSYMRTSFVKYSDFDTEHTRFASKYSLHMYREMGIDEDTRVG